MRTATAALPVFCIEEIEFFVDCDGRRLIEAGNDKNVISMDEIGISELAPSEFVYDRRIKNICQNIIDPCDVPTYVAIVIVPPLQQLDPVWAAERKLLESQRKLMAHSDKKPVVKHLQKGVK